MKGTLQDFCPGVASIKQQLLGGYDEVVSNLEAMADPYASVAGAVSVVTPVMAIPTSADPLLLAHRKEIEGALQIIMRPLEHLLDSFRGEYSAALKVDVDSYMEGWRECAHDLQESRAEVHRLQVRTHACTVRAAGLMQLTRLVSPQQAAKPFRGKQRFVKPVCSRASLAMLRVRQRADCNLSIAARLKRPALDVGDCVSYLALGMSQIDMWTLQTSVRALRSCQETHL